MADLALDANDIRHASARYAFVLDNELPALKPSDAWWNERASKRRLREGSDKALDWLAPFVPVRLVDALPLHSARNEWGPMQAPAIAKELRAAIRARRKAKEPVDELLRALYGASLLADFTKALRFEYVQPHRMAQFLSAAELRRAELDYTTIGYKHVEALLETDIKWLVDAFGEPVEHRPVADALAKLVQSCVSRHCWMELKAASNYGNDRDAMQEWLDWQVGIRLRIERDAAARFAERVSRYGAELDALRMAWEATAAPFVVADLETTGLNADTDEVLEFAAIQVTPGEVVTREFSALVRVAHVPAEIATLTGITQQRVNLEGRSLIAGLRAFSDFVGAQPVFFFNAPFDQGFLQKASKRSAVPIPLTVHDILPLARQAWPTLQSHKLAALAEHVGAPAPSHRGLSDARAALAVLMAARKVVAPGH